MNVVHTGQAEKFACPVWTTLRVPSKISISPEYNNIKFEDMISKLVKAFEKNTIFTYLHIFYNSMHIEQ